MVRVHTGPVEFSRLACDQKRKNYQSQQRRGSPAAEPLPGKANGDGGLSSIVGTYTYTYC